MQQLYADKKRIVNRCKLLFLNDNTYFIFWICFKNAWCSAYVLTTDSFLIRTWSVLFLFFSSVQLVHPVAEITHCCNNVTTQRIQICEYNSILCNIFNKNNMLHIWIYEYVQIWVTFTYANTWIWGGACARWGCAVCIYAQWQRLGFLLWSKCRSYY